METITKVEGVPVAVVGEKICDREYLKGYNTYFEKGGGDGIIAATCGVVEVVEKVVSIRGLDPRYMAEVGDVVVGRITEVSGNRWKCSIGSAQDAIMLLSNVTEPGGVLRRRGRDDELTMRNIFGEGDVVVAEVQRLLAEGVVSLHTRSAEKFGKVQGSGLMVCVNPALLRRTKSHFHVFYDYGVSMVMGVNGKIWLSIANETNIGWAGSGNAGAVAGAEASVEEGDPASPAGGAGGTSSSTIDPAEARQHVARIRNCIVVLDRLMLSIHPHIIGSCVDALIQQGIASREVLSSEQASQIIFTTAAAAKADLFRVGGIPTKRNRDD